MKRLVMSVLLIAGMNCWAAVVLSNVKIQQRYPWNGKVDISFKLASTREYNSIQISAHDTSTGKSLNVSTLYDENGNLVSTPLKMSPGKKHLVWDADSDVESGFSTDSLSVTVQAGRYYDLPLYQVIDLSGGPSAERFPITSMNEVPEGGWTKEHKTTKLVLRLIQPGRVHLGPQNCNGYLDEADAIITKPFYLGIYKVTRKQWELVMGNFDGIYTNSTWSVERTFKRYTNCLSVASLEGITIDHSPVAEVPCTLLRGAEYLNKWPMDKSVASDSFFGVLRRKTTVEGFDLPTEAEWEHAARAGTTENHNLPFRAKDDVANSWGLYEMMDNIAEWCVDGYFASYEEQYHGQVLSDPIGNPASIYRNCRNHTVLEVGIGQRGRIAHDWPSGGTCPISFRAGCFPYR